MKSRLDRADKRASMLDVQLLDVFGQIEALLRNGREVQRELLRIRGVPDSVSADQRRKAADRIHKLLTGMLDDTREVSQVVRPLRSGAKALTRR